MLARQIGIDVDEVQELKGVFDSFDRTRSGLLDRSGFRALIKGAFAFDKKDDIPDEFLDARWFELQSLDENRIPTIDFEGFLRWYQAHWFVEQLLINKAVRFTRNVARKHGLGFANVERIYRVFVEFDEDCSRKIEPPEFRKLICRLLGLQTLSEVSENMLRNLWSGAAGQMEAIDFETFLLWYTQHFGEDEKTGNGAHLLQEYYRYLRPHAMMPAANTAERSEIDPRERNRARRARAQ